MSVLIFGNNTNKQVDAMDNIKAATTNRKLFAVSLLGIGALLSYTQTSYALTYVLPANGNIVGNVQYANVHPGDSLSTLGRRYDIGGYEMVEANPKLNYSHPARGARVLIPSRFVLPEGSRKGIVINLAEMRLYFYHPDGVHVSTYPVGVGQEGWNTPLGKTSIVRKREHPTWVVPDSIMENQAAHGQPIPPTQGPGPTNPLGDYAMNTGLQNIVIHGSPFPKGVGVRSSHGCIRMLPEDVEELFHNVKVGTPVQIVNQTTKVGRLDDKLYLEAHEPLSKDYSDMHGVGTLIHKMASQLGKQYAIEWNEVQRVQSKATGYPLPIGTIGTSVSFK